MGHAAKVEFDVAPFRGFGPSTFWPFRRRLQTLDVTHDFAELRRSMRDECPRRPGVYGMLDVQERLIYVGMSLVLPKRLVTYFQSGPNERKEYRIAAHTNRLVWEVIGHGLAAELRELELIRRHQPRFNVRGRRSGRALGYIYISREEAPRVRVARQAPRGVRYAWGPLAVGWRINEAVETVNRYFKLRDCRADVPMHFAEQQNLFALELRAECLRGETGSCIGPCAALCTRSQYTAQLRAARAFLDGRDASPLTQLEEELKTAAATQQFEHASTIRDKLVRLTNLSNRLAVLREPPLEEEFVYAAQVGRRTIWYVAAASRIVTAMLAPTSPQDARKCLRKLQNAYSSQSLAHARTDRLATQILAGWFRGHPEERERKIAPGAALECCRRMGA
jgi:excinuclease ABC subunit C